MLATVWRPSSSDDRTANAVTYDGRDVFTTSMANLVAYLRRHTTVCQTEKGYVFTAPGLLLSLRRAGRAGLADDEGDRFPGSALVARPGYCHHSAEPDGPSQESWIGLDADDMTARLRP